MVGRTERGNGGCGYGARVEGGRVGLVKGEGGKMGWGEEDEAGRARGRTEQEDHGVYWADEGKRRVRDGAEEERAGGRRA